MRRSFGIHFLASTYMFLLCLMGMLVYCCVTITSIADSHNNVEFIRDILNIALLHWFIIPLGMLWNYSSDKHYYNPVCLTRYPSLLELLKKRLIVGIFDAGIFSLSFCAILVGTLFMAGFSEIDKVLLGCLSLWIGITLIVCSINCINVIFIFKKYYHTTFIYIVAYTYLIISYLAVTGWLEIDVHLIYRRIFSIQYYALFDQPIKDVLSSIVMMVIETIAICRLSYITIKQAHIRKLPDIKPIFAIPFGFLGGLPFAKSFDAASEYLSFILGGEILEYAGVEGILFYGFPIVVLCLLYGGYVFKNYAQTSTYVIPRFGSKEKWCCSRLRELFMRIMAFTFYYVVGIILALFVLKKGHLDFTAIQLLVLCYTKMVAISFFLLILSNILGFYLKPVIGIITMMVFYLSSLAIGTVVRGDGFRVYHLISPTYNSVYTWDVWGHVFGKASYTASLLYLVLVTIGVTFVSIKLFTAQDII